VQATPQRSPLVDKRVRRRPLVGLTPLIDVVFILLIFFMLSTSLVQWRAIDLPSAAKGASSNAEKRSLMLDIYADDRLELDGKPVDADDLIAALQNAVKRQDAEQLYLRPNTDASLQQTISILDRVTVAKVINEVSMARRATP